MIAAAVIAFAMATAPVSAPVNTPANAHNVKVNWMLNCQGCHQADATGSPGGAPNMAGLVSRFLTVEGGREYLVRVPGVATSPLDNEALAALVNWMLVKFDPEHMPENFTPYTADEIAILRAHPLISDAGTVREKLIQSILSTDTTESKN
jgi:mono/diheme cytochrome c family protein